MPCKDEPDFASPDTFCFAAVRADYNECKFSQLNHFVPLFYKGRVGEGLWATIAEGSLQRLEKRLEQLRVDTATQEVQDEYVFSMIEVIAKMEQQINFTRKMHEIGFHPASVPADGNCALWSLLSLEGGCVARAQLCSREQMMKMRVDARHGL